MKGQAAIVLYVKASLIFSGQKPHQPSQDCASRASGLSSGNDDDIKTSLPWFVVWTPVARGKQFCNASFLARLIRVSNRASPLLAGNKCRSDDCSSSVGVVLSSTAEDQIIMATNRNPTLGNPSVLKHMPSKCHGCPSVRNHSMSVMTGSLPRYFS